MEFSSALMCELDSQQSGSSYISLLRRSKNGFLHNESTWYGAIVCCEIMDLCNKYVIK